MQKQEAEKKRKNPEKHQAKLLAMHEWHVAHPTYNEDWGLVHAEEKKEYGKDYREKNKEALLESANVWRSHNKEHVREYNKNYHATHWEEIALKAQRRHPAYYERTRDRHIARAQARRVRMLNAAIVEVFSDKEIFERDGWFCQLCLKKVNKRLKHPHPMSPSIDHVIPVSRGGNHSRQNVVLAHLRCNLRKHAKTVTQQQRLF